MTDIFVRSIRRGRTAEGDGFFRPALYISIAIAILAVVTQLVVLVTELVAAANGTSANSLSATQQLLMWLVAAGLVVLLWIAYAVSHAYTAAQRSEVVRSGLQGRCEQAEAEANQARAEAVEAKERRAEALAAKAEAEKEAERARAAAAEAEEQAEAMAGQTVFELKVGTGHENAQVRHASGQQGNGRLEDSFGDADDAWLPPDDLKQLAGSERSVSTATVFPNGCYLEPDSIRLVADKLNGRQVYECRILDLNPSLKDRPHETVVSLLADRASSTPPMPRYGLVQFDHLTITPYVTDRNPLRIRYSLHATGIRPATVTTDGRVEGIWTTTGSSDGASGIHGSSAGVEMLKLAGSYVAEEVAKDIVAGVLG